MAAVLLGLNTAVYADAATDKLQEQLTAAIDKQNFPQIIQIAGQLAERNDPRAQFILGKMYLHGAGVHMDLAVARHWLEKAAQQGHAEAQKYLQDLNEIQPTLQQVFQTQEAKAKQGNSRAQISLGSMYMSGAGVEKNTVLGIQWLEKAAQHDDTDAQEAKYMLGRLYEEGQYVKPSPALAVQWYEQAAQAGNAKAKAALQRLKNR